MRRIILSSLAMCCMALLSCRKEHPGTDVPGAPGLEDLGVPEYCIAGIEYPDGYDWVKDPSYGTVPCTMFLTGQTGRICSFKVGFSESVASDADMARCLGGHLYTNFASDGETVIKCDGKELFRYRGEEYIVGFNVIGEDVFTLGMPMGYPGWVYRKNGVLELIREDGLPVSDIQEDEGLPVFLFRKESTDPVVSSSPFYIVVDGKPSPVIRNDPYSSIVDALMVRGELQVLSNCWKNAPVLESRGRRVKMEVGKSFMAEASRMKYSGTSIYVEGRLIFMSGHMNAVIWRDGKIVRQLPPGMVVDDFFVDGNGLCVVYHEEGRPSCLYVSSETGERIMPEGYFYACGDMARSRYCICLNPERPGKRPLLYMDGDFKTVEVNGCWLDVDLI